MMWSSISRRQLPTQRSATPFCQGFRIEVLYGGDLQCANTSMYFQAVFLIMIEEQESGNRLVRKASRSCCTIQLLVGDRIVVERSSEESGDPEIGACRRSSAG